MVSDTNLFRPLLIYNFWLHNSFFKTNKIINTYKNFIIFFTESKVTFFKYKGVMEKIIINENVVFLFSVKILRDFIFSFFLTSPSFQNGFEKFQRQLIEFFVPIKPSATFMLFFTVYLLYNFSKYF